MYFINMLIIYLFAQELNDSETYNDVFMFLFNIILFVKITIICSFLTVISNKITTFFT